MKTLGIAALLLLAGTVSYAQQNTPVAPVPPSTPSLHMNTEDSANSRLDVELGAVRLTTHSGRYTFVYLPLLAPLPGTAFRPSFEMPNAFALTGTTIPQKPRTRMLREVQIH